MDPQVSQRKQDVEPVLYTQTYMVFKNIFRTVLLIIFPYKQLSTE